MTNHVLDLVFPGATDTATRAGADADPKLRALRDLGADDDIITSLLAATSQAEALARRFHISSKETPPPAPKVIIDATRRSCRGRV